MASTFSNNSQDSSGDEEGDYSYDELVNRTAGKMPTFEPLKRFLACTPAAKPTMNLITFPSGNDGRTQQDTVNGLTVGKLEEVIGTEFDGQRQLLLVQNITPDVVRLLGNNWKIPPDFFLSHLENSNWYSLWNIQQNLPGLRSACQSHVRFQFIGPREVETEKVKDKDRKMVYSNLPDRMHELDKCDSKEAATIGRTAGGFNPTYPPPRILSEMNPTVRADMPFMPVAMVRSTVTVWFDSFDHGHFVNNTESNDPHKGMSGEKGEETKWKRGVILFDLPFIAQDEKIRKYKRHNSIYRSFIHRSNPPHYSPLDFDTPRVSYMESYLKCMEQKFRRREFSTSIAPEPFDLLQDICRIIASEWILLNIYVERDLNNIDLWFEEVGEKCTMENLHHLLSRLMTARRRVTKYESLISDQINLCPHIWQTDNLHDNTRLPPAHCAQRNGPSPSGLLDFMHVRDRFSHNKTRIIEAIQVVTSLMAVKENEAVLVQTKQSVMLKMLAEQRQKLAEQRNMSLNLLTWVTALMFPFTAVASIMAIPSKEAAGPKGKFLWIYWVSSSLLCGGLILIVVTMFAKGWNFLKKKEHIESSGTPPAARAKVNAASGSGAEIELKSTVVQIHDLHCNRFI